MSKRSIHYSGSSVINIYTVTIISVLNDVPLAKIASVSSSDGPVVEKKNCFLFQGIENGSVDHLLIKETH